MSLKRQQDMLATFSMASMTDVIFLLLIFFMVTSSFVFPTALEIDLPESAQQTPVKPSTRVYVDSVGSLYVSTPDSVLVPVVPESLVPFLTEAMPVDSIGAIAVYADARVPYGKVVEVLNLGADNNLKMVLATKPTAPVEPVTEDTTPTLNSYE